MATTLIHKKSSTTTSEPIAGDLSPGEVAVNLADKKLFTKTVGGTIIELCDGVKLAGIEALADVTSTTNVTAAGALMDSELAGEAAVKATTAAFLIADETKLDAIFADATIADYRANVADRVLTTDVVWGALAEVTLTDAANISWDTDTGLDFTVTLGGNRTLDNATNQTVGKKGRIRVVQDGTGTRTLAYGTNYVFPGGADPVLTTASGSEDYLYYDWVTTSKCIITLLADVK